MAKKSIKKIAQKTDTPAQAPVPPKPPGFFKRMERRFFNVFNDKSSKRRKNAMRLMLLPAALGVAGYWHDDPSKIRGSGGAEQVEQYRRDIHQIAMDSRAFAITPDGYVVRGDVKALVDLDNRMKALATQLALDARISEQDALDLTRQFIRDINDPVVGKQLRETLEALSENAAFLDDARKALARQGVDHGNNGMQAAEVLDKADSKGTSDYLSDLLIAYLLLKVLFGDNVMNMLRRGSRRDDQLKKEERAEIILDNAAKIRAMLTPKGETPPPADVPPPPPAPVKKKTTGGVTKRA